MRLRLTMFRRPLDHGSWDASDEPETAAVMERYAGDGRVRSSFEPDGAALSRMKAVATSAYAGAFVSVVPARSNRRRRILAMACAVTILVVSGIGAAAAESGPGQPFYRLRLQLEALNLPPAGTLPRLDSDLDRANSRLDDIANQVSRLNAAGVSDAAGAYGQVVSTIRLPASGVERAQAVERLTEQLARLEILRASSQGAEIAELDADIVMLSDLLGVPVPRVAPAGSGAASPGGEPNSSGSVGPSVGPSGSPRFLPLPGVSGLLPSLPPILQPGIPVGR